MDVEQLEDDVKKTPKKQTAADLEALNKLRVLMLARERCRRRPKYLEGNYLLAFGPGDRVVWLWYAEDGIGSPLPVKAIVLQSNKVQAQIRAEFAAGPVVLWVGLSRLRHPKTTRRG